VNVSVEEKPDGAPEWMVSFADMITIMMSFFVIMYAVAKSESGKGDKKRSAEQQAVIDSIQYRFGPNWRPFASWGLLPGVTPVKASSGRTAMVAAPPSEDGKLKFQKRDPVRIRVPGRGNRIVIGGVASFRDGQSQLDGSQKPRLRAIAEELAGKPQEIEVLGYASNRPLPDDAPYRDRWDLAYARCRQVAQALRDLKIEPERIRVSVIRANDDGNSGNPPNLLEESRVDVYLTDALNEAPTPSGP
jgi:chemotaxis protein MotB